MSADAAPGGYRLALSAYLIWGLAPLFWKLLDVPAMQLTAHRFWQVLVIGAVILWVRDRRSIRSLVADRRLTLVHLGAGALLAVNWLVYVYSIATDRVVDSSLGLLHQPSALGRHRCRHRRTPHPVAVARRRLGRHRRGDHHHRCRVIAVDLPRIGIDLRRLRAHQEDVTP